MNARIIIATIMMVYVMVVVPVVGTNYTVDVAVIPDSENGDIINAQTWNNGDGTYMIIMAPTTMEDPQVNRVMAHEIAHAVDWEGDEAYADDYANRVIDDGSEPIVDKYHGVH